LEAGSPEASPEAAPAEGGASEAGIGPNFSFFVTSTGSTTGGNLGGLLGADTKCQTLAAAVGAGAKTWHAYLSVSAREGGAAVNARDRIGSGPWYNVNGDLIAQDLATLHEENDAGMNGLTGATGLDEKGARVPTGGDSGTNEHDILTGSMPDGRAFPALPDYTCAGWTSSEAAPVQVRSDAGVDGGLDAAIADATAPLEAGISFPVAYVGHVNRTGSGAPPTNNESWNSSHATRSGCSQAALVQVGGAGRLYCFAVGTGGDR
jgi:hypothetical protein